MLEIRQPFKCTGLRLNPNVTYKKKSEDHQRGEVPCVFATLEPQKGHLLGVIEIQVPEGTLEMGKVYKLALTEVKEEALVNSMAMTKKTLSLEERSHLH